MNRLGGWTEVKPVTPEVIKICLEVRTAVEEKYGICFKMYFPVVYSSQVVNGVNYLVKVMVDGDGVCVHLNIYQSFTEGGKPSVTEIKFPKSFDHQLILF